MLLKKIMCNLYTARLAVTSPVVYEYYRFFQDSQFWTKKKLESYQFSKIKELIYFAYENHPFYREHFDKHGVHPSDYRKLDDIVKFPIVTKEQLKSGLNNNKFNIPEKAIWHSTSGSSGEPFTFPIDLDGECMRKACKLRTEQWYGKRLGNKWVRLWRSGPRGFKRKLLDLVLSRKIEITFYELGKHEENRLDDNKLQKFVDLINRSGAEIVEGYVSALSLVADYATRTQQDFPTIKTVVTGAEYLSVHARKKICEGFGARVFNRYGGTEIGLIAHDNQDGEFVSMSDRLFFEALYNSSSKSSDLLITDFTNKAMPFIRYEVGDCIEAIESRQLSQDRKSQLPVMGKVLGRINDFFTMPDGSLLTSHIWHVFFRDKPVRKFQVIQKKDKSITVKVVPAEQYHPEQVITQLHELVPNVEIEVEVVNDIDHGANGKYRHTITELHQHINLMNSDIITPARNISAIAAYIPVADDDIDNELSLKLDWNESTLENPVTIRDALKLSIDKTNFLNWYPPVEKNNIKRMLETYINVSARNIELFPGSDSAIDFICKVFLNDNDVVGLVEPTYDQARLTFQIHGAQIKRYKFNDVLNPTCDELMGKIKGSEKLVYLSSPNNPVGNVWAVDDIRRLLMKYPTVLFVVDEAYMDFCQKESAVSLITEFNNIIVTRTFSKALGLASMRLGYTVHPHEYNEIFSKVINVKDINSLSLIAASTLLSDLKFLKSQIEKINEGREYLAEKLQELGYFVVNGQANFILLRVENPALLIAHLASNRIYVRDRSKYPGLDGFVRITAGSVEQMTRLVEVINCYEG